MRQTLDHTYDGANDPAEPSFFWKLFGLEVRSLAFLRIGLGFVLLCDLLFRSQFLTAHYTDAGALPRTLRKGMGLSETCVAPAWQLSLHMLSGSPQWQAFLFVLAAIVAVALLVGYRTRLATIASWALLVSLHARNPVVLNGGDDLLRCGLFWAMLLPLGKVWSLDAKCAQSTRQKSFAAASDNGIERDVDGRLISFATVGLILQLYCMYWFTAILKWDPSWRVDMTAVHYALSYDHFTTRLGYWLLNYPNVLWWLTLGTIILEFFGPIVLLLPIWNRKLRIIVPILFIGLHVGLAATMQLGLFPVICGLFWTALLPGECWDRVSAFFDPHFQRQDRKLRLYQPGDQSIVPFNDQPDNGTDATNEVRQKWIYELRWIKRIYDLRRFYEPKWIYYGTQALAVYCILFMVWQNTVRLEGGIHADVPNGLVRIIGRSAQLNQYWSMFSPAPPKHGGWLVIKGTLTDGSQVNLLNHDEGLEDERPTLISSTYPSQRWRKNLMTLFERHSPHNREGTCDYLVRRWNETHCCHLQVAKAEILVVVEPTVAFSKTEDTATNAGVSSIVSLYSREYAVTSAGVDRPHELSSL